MNETTELVGIRALPLPLSTRKVASVASIGEFIVKNGDVVTINPSNTEEMVLQDGTDNELAVATLWASIDVALGIYGKRLESHLHIQNWRGRGMSGIGAALGKDQKWHSINHMGGIDHVSSKGIGSHRGLVHSAIDEILSGPISIDLSKTGTVAAWGHIEAVLNQPDLAKALEYRKERMEAGKVLSTAWYAGQKLINEGKFEAPAELAFTVNGQNVNLMAEAPVRLELYDIKGGYLGTRTWNGEKEGVVAFFAQLANEGVTASIGEE